MYTVIPFIGRSRELSILVEAIKPHGIPSRSLLFIVGPSGIGKTRLTLESINRLIASGFKIPYISLTKSYSDVEGALEDFINQANIFIKENMSAYKKVVRELSSVLRTIDLETGLFSIRLGVGRESTLGLFNDIIYDLSRIVCSKDYGAIVIDELQNLLRLYSSWSPRNLIKSLIDIQEYMCSGRLRFVFITSDFLFRERVLMDNPVEYFVTFYLGEMTYDDTVSLIKEVFNRYGVVLDREDVIEDIAMVIGGSPMIIQVLADLAKTRGLTWAIKFLVYNAIEDLRSKVYMATTRYSVDIKLFIEKVVDDIVEEPIDSSDIIRYPELHSVVKKLIEYNILQYAPRECVGVYKWNKISGEIAPLTVIAPSTRTYLYALCRIAGRESSACMDIGSCFKKVVNRPI